MIVNVQGRPVTSQKRMVSVTEPRLFEYLSWADPLLPNHHLTIACPRCQQSLHGANHESDAVWSLECDCTRWEWRRAATRVAS